MSRAAARTGLLVAFASIAQARADTPLFASMPALEMQPSWPLLIGATLVALIVGFVLGWRTLGRRIRKKYGGLKIY